MPPIVVSCVTRRAKQRTAGQKRRAGVTFAPKDTTTTRATTATTTAPAETAPVLRVATISISEAAGDERPATVRRTSTGESQMLWLSGPPVADAEGRPRAALQTMPYVRQLLAEACAEHCDDGDRFGGPPLVFDLDDDEAEAEWARKALGPAAARERRNSSPRRGELSPREGFDRVASMMEAPGTWGAGRSSDLVARRSGFIARRIAAQVASRIAGAGADAGRASPAPAAAPVCAVCRCPVSRLTGVRRPGGMKHHECVGIASNPRRRLRPPVYSSSGTAKDRQ